MPDILTVDHPRWAEFKDLLEGPEGCHFREEGGQTRWTCGNTLALAEKLLRTMSGINAEATLAHFGRHGGYCDCEVLFNVASIELGEIAAAARDLCAKAGKEPKCPTCGAGPERMDWGSANAAHISVVLCLACGAEVARYDALAALEAEAAKEKAWPKKRPAPRRTR